MFGRFTALWMKGLTTFVGEPFRKIIQHYQRHQDEFIKVIIVNFQHVFAFWA